MYVPPQFRETRPEVLDAAIASIRLATLVTSGPAGLEASHAPVVLKVEPDGTRVLETHLARANPHWRACPAPALAVFQGPQAYVSPGWYASKREHGKVVPTWNYVAVHVRGPLEVVEDEAWLLAHLRELSDQGEAGQPRPWSVGDAPDGFVPALARAVVGLRLRAERIEGAWKLIQHRPEADRLGAIAGLEASARDGDRAVAGLMREAEAGRGRA